MGIQLKVDGRTKGPFSESEIREMIELGGAKPTDLARAQGKNENPCRSWFQIWNLPLLPLQKTKAVHGKQCRPGA